MDKPKPKNRTMRFTDDQWATLQSEAERRGYSGPNALMAAIADGDLPVGTEPARLNTYASRLGRVEMLLTNQWAAIEELRRAVAGVPPLGPTELP